MGVCDCLLDADSSWIGGHVSVRINLRHSADGWNGGVAGRSGVKAVANATAKAEAIDNDEPPKP